MTTLQIILVSIFGVLAIVSLAFIIAFVVEITKEPKDEEVIKSSIFNSNETEESVDDMLANLDEQTKEEVKEDEIEQAVEVMEEVVEETEDKTEENVSDEGSYAENLVESQEVEAQEVEPKIVVVTENSNIDYEARLKQVVENKEKLEKDLAKIDNAILKYDRTARRMERNQKMLDRRASELTNLNLVMYSVTDIKNVDEDKKVKQEELTSHIAELKASIQDAEEFLESNKEKNEHNVKMATFLRKEIARYDEEIVEIKKILDEKND